MGTGYKGWFHAWSARSEQVSRRRQAQIEQARLQWVQHRVWAGGETYRGYAWIESIGDDGWVVVDYERVPYGYPSRIKMKFEALGTHIVLAHDGCC